MRKEYIVRIPTSNNNVNLYKTNMTNYELNKLQQSYELLYDNNLYIGNFTEYIILINLQQKYSNTYIEFYKEDYPTL